MIRHAIAEGFVVLRERAAVSVILALVLGVPIALAGVGMTLHQWLGPVADLSGQQSSVAVLLHPQMEPGERRRWIADLSSDHPDWIVSEVSSSDLAERLQRCDAAVIMKVGRNLAKVRRAVEAAGLMARAIYVERGTMSDERIVPLCECTDAAGPYFAIVLIPGEGRRL